MLIDEIRRAKRVYVVGNGGSASNAEHVVNDLLSVGVRAFSINVAFFSATANDCGHENSFSRWINVVGESGDLLIAFSGSGRSPNILKACEAADKLGMTVYRIFGNERGEDMQQAEEAQIAIGHELMRELRRHKWKG